MLIVTVCEKYGWDYNQYMAQPSWFLDLVALKMRLDNEEAKRDINRSNKKYGRQ